MQKECWVNFQAQSQLRNAGIRASRCATLVLEETWDQIYYILDQFDIIY